VIVAGTTAVVSCGLLVLAVWRGWLGPEDVLNTRSLAELQELLRRR